MLRPIELDEPALVERAASLAALVRGGGVIHLEGPLGAGKTTFARALLKAMGVGERVKSPTYSLIESYCVGDLEIHHLDLYRIADAGELEWLGLDDLLAAPSLILVEWPQRGDGALPAADMTIVLAHAGRNRRIEAHAHSARAVDWLRVWSALDAAVLAKGAGTPGTTPQ